MILTVYTLCLWFSPIRGEARKGKGGGDPWHSFTQLEYLCEINVIGSPKGITEVFIVVPNRRKKNWEFLKQRLRNDHATMLYLREPLSPVWIAMLCELGIHRTKIDRSFFHCQHMLTWFFFQILKSYRISYRGIRFLNVSQHEFIKNWLIIVFLNFPQKGSISDLSATSFKAL